jgi:hypothetical protein
MSLTPLLDHQKLIIDDHSRGNREVKDWRDPAKDVHIDKHTKYSVDGKHRTVRIRIPINSDREIQVHIDGDRQAEMPRKLYREIQDTLNNDPEKSKTFAREVAEILSNYGSSLSTEEKTGEALNRIAEHFDLDWTKDKIATYINGALMNYTQLYRDINAKAYYITMAPGYLELSDITGWSKHAVWLAGFR